MSCIQLSTPEITVSGTNGISKKPSGLVSIASVVGPK